MRPRLTRLGLTLIAALLLLAPHLTTAQTQPASKPREILRLGRGTANTLAWRPDGKVLAVGSATGIWLYDEHFNELAHLETTAQSGIHSIQWSPDASRIVTISENRDANQKILATFVQIWSAKSARLVASYTPGKPAVRAWWSPDSSQLALDINHRDTNDYAVQTINAATGQPLARLPLDARSVTWSPDSRLLAISAYDGKSVTFWNATSGEIVERDTVDGVKPVAWSPDGTKLALGMNDGTIRIWDVSDLMQHYSPSDKVS